MDDRTQLLLADLPKDAKLIEIGPSYNPLAPRRDGWNTTIIDHETRDGLVAKYRDDPGVDTSRIEDVDFVWHGEPLGELVGSANAGTYDAFIASHVIEHTTDVVRFLQAARSLVKDEGVVILAVPDKRLCFDFFRPISTTGEAVVAYREKRQRHSAKTHFDYAMYQCSREARPGWEPTCQTDAVLTCRIESGLDFMARAEMDAYVDAHAWTFTPSSFELMILELRALGLLHLSVERVRTAPLTEFYAWLRPCEELEDFDTIHRYRLGLLNRIVVEQAEACRQVIGSPLGDFDSIRVGL